MNLPRKSGSVSSFDKQVVGNSADNDARIFVTALGAALVR